MLATLTSVIDSTSNEQCALFGRSYEVTQNHGSVTHYFDKDTNTIFPREATKEGIVRSDRRDTDNRGNPNHHARVMHYSENEGSFDPRQDLNTKTIPTMQVIPLVKIQEPPSKSSEKTV